MRRGKKERKADGGDYLDTEKVVKQGADEVVMQEGWSVSDQEGEDGQAGGLKVSQDDNVSVGTKGFQGLLRKERASFRGIRGTHPLLQTETEAQTDRSQNIRCPSFFPFDLVGQIPVRMVLDKEDGATSRPLGHVVLDQKFLDD